MCTAINLTLNHHFFGRNLDLECNYGELGVTTPEYYKLAMKHTSSVTTKYAVIGAGLPANGFPLYFDAMNSEGLCGAALNFPYCAVYKKPTNTHTNLCSFELIPYVLSQCKDLTEAINILKNVNITDDSFSEYYPATPLHWLFADKSGAVVAEPTKIGMTLNRAETGVLTNSPEYSFHVDNLKSYTDLSPKNPFGQNSHRTSLGIGSSSLPGGMTSEDRFVRASFFTINAQKASEVEERSNFFTILGAVTVPKGTVKTEKGVLHYTRYTSCCDTDSKLYMYKPCTSLLPNILYFDEGSIRSDKVTVTKFN